MKVSLGTTAGATNLNTGYLSICVDDTQSLSFTGPSSFQVKPSPMAALTGDAAVGGRVAYLFNHYGNSSLTNVTGPALQLAIWELVYDGSNEKNADFAAGDFQLSGDVTTINGANAADVIAQAKQFFAESAGKSETAVFLKTATDSKDGQQSMLAHGSLNFANASNCPPTPDKDHNPCDGGKDHDRDHGPKGKDGCDRDDDHGPRDKKDDCSYGRDHGPKGKDDCDKNDDDRGGKGGKPSSCDSDRDRDRNDRDDRGQVCDTDKPSKGGSKDGGDSGGSCGGRLFDRAWKWNGCR
ncbi:MAG: hypothetical protein U0835_22285 [Isosphaeraceae bacterium]